MRVSKSTPSKPKIRVRFVGELAKFEFRLNSVKLLGVIDANQDGFVTRDETFLSPEQFKLFEFNGDGKISKDEFRGPDRFWSRLDGDGDGVVTRKEADAAGGRMGGRGGRSPRGEGRGGMRGGARGLSFATLDLDKDGSVSAREWALFMEKADENKDQILQKEEWDAAVGNRPLRDDAPKVGSKAPKVSAKMIDLPLAVDLSKPKRTTVLIFGSWT